MANDTTPPEIDRRQRKESGIVGHIFETLVGKQSRKVAFGVWVFIIANGMKERHAEMPWELWWKCVLLAGALIGLGTILDEIVLTFGRGIAAWAATKATTVLESKTTVEKTVTAQQ